MSGQEKRGQAPSRHEDLNVLLGAQFDDERYEAKKLVAKMIENREKRQHQLCLAELRASSPPPNYDKALLAAVLFLSVTVMVESWLLILAARALWG